VPSVQVVHPERRAGLLISAGRGFDPYPPRIFYLRKRSEYVRWLVRGTLYLAVVDSADSHRSLDSERPGRCRAASACKDSRRLRCHHWSLAIPDNT
jgi:hypothetical protein